MEPNKLSENWRKLKLQLKASDTKPQKRKLDLDRPAHAPKRQRMTSQPGKLSHQEQVDVVSNGKPRAGTKIPSASLALWAEDNDISAKDLAAAYGSSLKDNSIPEVANSADVINGGLSTTAEAGRYVAIDCEMVGVGPDPNRESALARVSIINYHGELLYDSFVLTKEDVTDYRTAVSGITPQLLRSARSFEEVQADVARLLDGKTLIGHAVRNDLDALLLGHPKRDIRDTSRHPAFKRVAGGRTPALKRLARDILSVDIQGGEHSSIEDARATMLLFRRDKDGFEREHLANWGPDRNDKHKPTSGEVKSEKKKSKKKKKRGK